MSTRVWESRVIKAPVSHVWSLLRPLDFSFLKSVATASLDSESKNDGRAAWSEVGRLRTLKYNDKDGTQQRIKLTELSDASHKVSYDLVSSEPPADCLSKSYSVELRRVTEKNHTLAEVTVDLSADASANSVQDAKFKAQEFLEDLAVASEPAVVPTGFKYPVTTRKPTVEELHGVKVEDPYRWLEDPDSPETVAWVQEQNKVTNAFLDTCTTRDKVAKRLTQLYNYERVGCPQRRGKWYFFFKNDGLQNQSVFYKMHGLEGKAEVLIDPNILEADGTASLGTYEFTENGEYLAYGVARSGSDWNTIHVRRVEDSKDLEDKVEWVKFSNISWTHDNKGFFYSRYPAPKVFEKGDTEHKRGTETQAAALHTVYFHVLGTPQSADIKVYEQPDEPKWLFTAEVSTDGRYLTLSIGQDCDPVNRMYLLDLHTCDLMKPETYKWIKLVDNFDAQFNYIDNEGTIFYFKSNLKAPRYKIVSIDITKADAVEWKDVVPEHKENVLESVSILNKDVLVCTYMEHVKEILKLYRTNGEVIKDQVPFPTLGAVVGLTGRKEDTEFFYKFSSFLYPGMVYRYDLKTHQQTLWHQTQIVGFDPAPFVVDQVFYPSKDGTKIPMFLIHPKDMPRDGNQPVFLYGYGGFNISLNPTFSVARVMWAQHFRGIIAVANLRGGGEYGEEWHKAGTLHNKQNVFDDFHAAAEYLIKEKYTTASKIAINGGSNGGLLVAACVNQRPELFGAAVAAVGVLDMLRFHKFTIGYAWCSDYGCADKKEDFEYLYKYSPLHNINKEQPYPSVLITTADHDDRVVPLHSFKYIANLQYIAGANPKQTAPLLIRIETKAGHGAGKPLSKTIEEQADMYAFLAKQLGADWHD